MQQLTRQGLLDVAIKDSWYDEIRKKEYQRAEILPVSFTWYSPDGMDHESKVNSAWIIQFWFETGYIESRYVIDYHKILHKMSEKWIDMPFCDQFFENSSQYFGARESKEPDFLMK
jgi:hypothetical protein